jgi:hypothetical protein
MGNTSRNTSQVCGKENREKPMAKADENHLAMLKERGQHVELASKRKRERPTR